MKKLVSLILAIMLVLAVAIPAMAITGKGSITVTNATVDETYTAYLIFPATIDGNGNIAYTYSGTLPENDYFTKDSAGNVTATDAAKDAKGFLTAGAITFLATLKGDAAAEQKAESKTVIFDNLPYGYYYIETTTGVAVTINSTNPDVSVYDKNLTTDIDKVIVEGTGDDQVRVYQNDVNVGDKVDFEVTVDAPNYNGAEYVTRYFVYDQMSEALTYNKDLVVKVNDTVISNYTVENKKAFSDEEGAPEYNFVITIPWVDAKGDFLYDETTNVILVTYSATVNEKIEAGEAMENTATVKVESQPTKPETIPQEETPEPTPDDPSKTTESYGTTIGIKKTDATGKTLTGAKFGISGTSYKVSMVNNQVFAEVGTAKGTHYMLKDGTFTTDEPQKEVTYPKATDEEREDGGFVLENGTYREATPEDLANPEITIYIKVNTNTHLYDSLEKKYAIVDSITKETDLVSIVDEGWVDKNGMLYFAGLGEGTYTITELIAPDGYNLLTEPITVTVTFDEVSKTFSATLSDEEGADVYTQGEDGVIEINVINNAGTELPTTGGIGTTIFYALGGILLVGAAVLLITKKRMGAHE